MGSRQGLEFSSDKKMHGCRTAKLKALLAANQASAQEQGACLKPDCSRAYPYLCTPEGIEKHLRGGGGGGGGGGGFIRIQ